MVGEFPRLVASLGASATAREGGCAKPDVCCSNATRRLKLASGSLESSMDSRREAVSTQRSTPDR
jgi:hypothetical protein